MAKLNSEFNYRTQVIGETPWEKIKTLKGFLDGRIRAAALEEVGRLKYEAKLAELDHLKSIGGLPHVILNLQAEILEQQSFHREAEINFRLNEDEIACLTKLLAELYAEVEPTRIPGYTDEQMFEVNAANEFTVWVAKEIHAEIIATGHPSPARLRNAMSCPQAWETLKQVGLIPKDAFVLTGSADPACITLKKTELLN